MSRDKIPSTIEALADFIYETQNYTDAKEAAAVLWPRLSASLLDGLGEKIVQKRACIEGAVTAEGDEHKSGGAA